MLQELRNTKNSKKRLENTKKQQLSSQKLEDFLLITSNTMKPSSSKRERKTSLMLNSTSHTRLQFSSKNISVHLPREPPNSNTERDTASFSRLLPQLHPKLNNSLMLVPSEESSN